MCQTILIRDGKVHHYVTEPKDLIAIIGRENFVPQRAADSVCLCQLDMDGTAAKAGYIHKRAYEIPKQDEFADWYWDKRN